MDSGIVVGLALAVLFFGCIIWLVIHVRVRERARGANEERTPGGRGDASERPDTPPANGKHR